MGSDQHGWTWTRRCSMSAMENVNFNDLISSVSNRNNWVLPELKGRAPFRPMTRQDAQLSEHDWNNIQNAIQPMIYFSNEPACANISAERAADAWLNQIVPLRAQKGKQLVSPSCSNDEASQA